MPMVNGKKFPYTSKGKMEAKMETKKTGKKMAMKKMAMKKMGKKK
jgi:hypothetical protein